MVRAATAIKKGELVLVPLTDGLHKISSKKSSGGILIKVNNSVLFVDAPGKPKTEDADKWHKGCIMQGFWWASTTSDAASANMKPSSIQHDGITIKVLKNSRAIKQYEVLSEIKAEQPEKKKPRIG